MLRAGALYYAVAVSLLIGLVSASLILLAYQQRIQSGQLMVYDQLIGNAHSALQLMLVQSSGSKSAPLEISLFGREDDSVAVWQEHWGMFACHYASAHSGPFRYTKVAMAGTHPKILPALYLADMGRPVSMGGNALVKGDAVLPAAGAKRAYIEGRSFTGTTLINGTTAVSERQLPLLSEPILNVSQTLGNLNAITVPVAENGGIGNTLFASFTDTALLMRHQGPITIQGGARLKGKIIVRSSVSITVTGNAALEDVILQAPIIVFENGFEGAVQAIATDSIVVGKGVSLKYPSGLMLGTPVDGSAASYIKLADDSKVSGMVVVPQPSSKAPGASVYIAPRALMEGAVFVGGKISLQGKVIGSLYCREFYLRTPSSVYENYLLDGTVDKTALHKLWQQPLMLKTQTAGGYIKWLY